MAWDLDKNGVTPSVDLNSTEQAHLNEFMNEVRGGKDPKSVADGWDSDYKNLSGDQYQIRLSRRNRVTFTVDHGNQLVTILQVGGHT
jgi:hypothetical protein